jgi:hypothetical protein
MKLDDSDAPEETNADFESDDNDVQQTQTFKEEIAGKMVRTPNAKALEDYKAAKDFVDGIIAAGQPWTDDKFPPTYESLTKNGSASQAQKCKEYEWKRASDIWENRAIFKDGVDPNDISQGALGDCYYLCTLSSMAEEGQRIMDRFVTKEVNDAGIYLLTLFINGVETPVIVDNFFPTCNDRCAFAHTNGGELWAPLLEKAWAKVHGSYAVVEGGFPLMASLHLQGVPGFQVEHKDINDDDKVAEFWQTLVHADKHNFAIMTASPG